MENEKSIEIYMDLFLMGLGAQVTCRDLESKK